MAWPWAIPLGLLIGAVLGAIGGGGAILTVPALIYIFGQGAGAATTGALIIVGLTSLVGVIPHQRDGNVRWREGLTFALLGIAGAAAGSIASVRVPDTVLTAAFSVLMLVVAAVMLRRLRGTRPDPQRKGWLAVIATATAVGLLTGFFGVGGGFAIVPALTLVLGFSMPAAVGTSLLVISINAATALGTRLLGGTGGLDWPLLLAFSVTAAAGSLLGARVGKRLGPRVLTISFVVLMIAVGLLMAAGSIPELL
ncbi:sulfite exporter TauE/SafE family protein [Tessaracoccus flavus]|uniref:Probable membrane transporter protein n=1 Tax=Tessaracoccus flavus TaxID=1610493 RepID=A0A1Q2CCV3_9ACTN|nr:sulfite exporter TauE/SafE family protein [Tessaracoccus flavus]AQP43926.1 hypothetical protein RPIT_03100 [Tessaracoccus flavus]SDY28908.1 hypothetical protein SAMN05428934_101221 [Tessaracoccus flavus]